MMQSIERTIRDYNICARHHKLNRSLEVDFFVNFLTVTTRNISFNNYRDGKTFEEMAKMMMREYNSDSRQLQVQGMVENLRLTS